ncbi:MAG: hypothetical protein KJ630_02105 [Proteobacteria bacterium]|nr:hypothetical protein [Pseudomonadota bacterium]
MEENIIEFETTQEKAIVRVAIKRLARSKGIIVGANDSTKIIINALLKN